MIACDECDVWQHAEWVFVDPTADVPDKHVPLIVSFVNLGTLTILEHTRSN